MGSIFWVFSIWPSSGCFDSFLFRRQSWVCLRSPLRAPIFDSHGIETASKNVLRQEGLLVDRLKSSFQRRSMDKALSISVSKVLPTWPKVAKTMGNAFAFFSIVGHKMSSCIGASSTKNSQSNDQSSSRYPVIRLMRAQKIFGTRDHNFWSLFPFKSFYQWPMGWTAGPPVLSDACPIFVLSKNIGT